MLQTLYLRIYIKKEIPYREGLMEDIGPAVGIKSYRGQGYEGEMSGVRMCLYLAPSTSCDSGALRDACGVRHVRVCAFPLLSNGQCGR